MTTLILGAGGFLGINLVEAMQARGLAMKCGRRKRSNVLALRACGATLVEADLDQPATLHAAMAGCKTVVHLAGHYPRLSIDAEGSLTVGVTQTDAVLEAAARAGIERLIYVSSTATVRRRTQGPSDERDVFAAAPGYGTYHDLKWQLERLVAAERRFETITVCPGACLGAHDWKIGTSAFLWQLIRGVSPAHPNGIISWVDVGDVALALAALVTRPQIPKRLLVVADSVDLHTLLVQLARRYGLPELEAPLSAPDAVTLADHEEARVEIEGGRPQLSREIADLIIHGAAINGHGAASLLNFKYRSLEHTLSTFEAWARRLGAPILPTGETPK